MAEFIGGNSKSINIDEHIIFENNTDSDFSVSAAIVFRKSGLYDVSIVGSRTIISKVAERKIGHWLLVTDNNGQHFICDQCGEWRYHQGQKFCGECGAYMQKGEGEKDS